MATIVETESTINPVTQELTKVLVEYADVNVPDEWEFREHERVLRPGVKTRTWYTLPGIIQQAKQTDTLGKISADKCDNHPLRREFYVELSRLRWMVTHLDAENK
jgi:hypothetical protein